MQFDLEAVLDCGITALFVAFAESSGNMREAQSRHKAERLSET
ncbi:MAG TPA: hypothetical protein VN441_00535 [Syntrophomonas sp.]|nr:hypothetical protein [Syntrophomonas sp.]